MQHSLNHLAIIMDGNARWATKHGKTKAEGHTAGAENAKKNSSTCIKIRC